MEGAADGAPLAEALATLAGGEGRRVVVVGDDRTRYIGLICVDRERQRLCMDADCHLPS